MNSSTCNPDRVVEVEEMTAEEGRQFFERLVGDRMGMTTDQFLRRLDRGDFDGVDSEDMVRLRLLEPFAR